MRLRTGARLKPKGTSFSNDCGAQSPVAFLS
jgi:hypothetical protein